MQLNEKTESPEANKWFNAYGFGTPRTLTHRVTIGDHTAYN